MGDESAVSCSFFPFSTFFLSLGLRDGSNGWASSILCPIILDCQRNVKEIIVLIVEITKLGVSNESVLQSPLANQTALATKFLNHDVTESINCHRLIDGARCLGRIVESFELSRWLEIAGLDESIIKNLIAIRINRVDDVAF